MPQSPELAGGEGFTYEGQVAAYYLTALLAEAHARGIDDRIVSAVAVQQRDFGEPLDDVIVDFGSPVRGTARLSLQVKRSLTISAATSNVDFRDIIRDSWATLAKSDFRLNIDRYGAAVDTVAAGRARALRTLCEYARESLTPEHFDRRFATDGNAGPEVRAVRDIVQQLLDELIGGSCSSTQIHKFLAHFVLLEFDMLGEGAADPPAALNQIRWCLAEAEATNAPLVWSQLVSVARASAGKAGQFDRRRLVGIVAQSARLRGASSLRADLDRLAIIARSYTEQISDDVGGTRLERPGLFQRLDRKLADARLVQVRGLPGSGKSALLRRRVQLALERGPVLFLKGDLLEGTGWTSFATAHGLSGAVLEDLLVEIGATGTRVLFIDGIDRVERSHQGVVLDVMRTVLRSPLLDSWRVVVSLRDAGIEVLRNWLGEIVDAVKVESVNVEALDDEEAEALAHAKPHLRSLLFGAPAVRDVVRRPFFARVLDLNFTLGGDLAGFAPQSEIDLVEYWWRGGGYDTAGQTALERQRALVALARAQARQLSQPIRLGMLLSISHLDALRKDGVLKDVQTGHSVRFAHDIFFEWAFFHALSDVESTWIEEIRACGEPPAMARAVELLAQWSYAQADIWSVQLGQTEASHLRSQWTRAWLLGALGSRAFPKSPEQFERVVWADDFRRLQQALVWFQAEKTTPNETILARNIPPDRRQRLADALGWPADFVVWRRFILFLLKRMTSVPARLYADVVAVFEVWQNVWADIENDLSRAILVQCCKWLTAIDEVETSSDDEDADPAHWAHVVDVKDLRRSLQRLVLRGARAESDLTEAYLRRVVATEVIRNSNYKDIITLSPVLAESHAGLLVDLTLAHLKQELPDDKVAEERARHDALSARRRLQPADQRGRVAAAIAFRPIGRFTDFDWNKLGIDHFRTTFTPPSPLREPFRSLFREAPDEALRLLRDLSNHAINTWRQLHKYPGEFGARAGTPIPLDLTFPWGKQRFWGGSREYLWSRGVWAPTPIACGFMALEEWCLNELEGGRSVHELLKRVVDGHECIAILGTAAMLALQAQAVCDAIFPLVTSQKLLSADIGRRAQDMSSLVHEIGFEPGDEEHVAAIRVAGARTVRQKDLRGLTTLYVLDDRFADRARAALEALKDSLPYEFEEHRDNARVQEHLLDEASLFAALADPGSYRTVPTNDPGTIALVHTSPHALLPENVAKLEQGRLHFQAGNLWTWASRTFEHGALEGGLSLLQAIARARELDVDSLFDATGSPEDTSVRRGGVAAVAAVVIAFREGASEADLAWARDVTRRVLRKPESGDSLWNRRDAIPWHPAIFAAHGLAAEIRAGTATLEMRIDLARLAGHPLEIVSIAAVKDACDLWRIDPQLTWAVLRIAFALCHVAVIPADATRSDEAAAASGLGALAEDVSASGEGAESWGILPLPPPAWVKTSASDAPQRNDDEAASTDAASSGGAWRSPNVLWNEKFAAKILGVLPCEALLASPAKSAVIDFLVGLVDWTIQKQTPPLSKPGRREDSLVRLSEWTYALWRFVGVSAGYLTLPELRPRFLDPMLQLEDENCWAALAAFSEAYVHAHLYDAATVPGDAVVVLGLCIDRLLTSPRLRRDAHRAGELSSYQQPRLVRVLMFVSVERAERAARYVNGDWSEIGRILPLIDRVIRAAGWAASVMEPFVTFVERARDAYPAVVFADQILSVLTTGRVRGWHGTFLPARIAGLVQYIAGRDSPLTIDVAQKFLRILDRLVDMGDRRSAALQLSEPFREIRLAER